MDIYAEPVLEYLRCSGFPVIQQERIKKMLRIVYRRASLRTKLSIAASFEHFISVAAKQVLEHGIFEGEAVDERLDRVWTWHALEELSQSRLNS